MSKLLVAVLVGLAAFAAMLVGMMALGSSPTDAADAPTSPRPAPPPAPGTTAAPATSPATTPPRTPGADGMVTVESVEAAWAAGPTLLVQVTLRNTGDASAEATTAAWTLRLQGDETRGRSALDAEVPPGRSVVAVAVPFDGDMAADWWSDYARADEKAKVAVEGTVAVESGGRSLSLPFAWERAWTGTLALHLEEAADCDASAATVCLASVSAEWSGDDLELRLKLRNRGDDSVRLRGAVGVAFAGLPVAADELDRTFVSSGGTASTEVRLAFSPDALASWWEGHAANCEASPVQLVLDLSDADGPIGPWTIPLPAFQTRIACGGAA